MLKDKQIFAWVLYDWANSAFATTIMAAVLPVFFSSVAGRSLAPHIASSYWGYTNTIAMLFIALSAPILGAMADYQGAKKRYLAVFLVGGIIGTAMLSTVGVGEWVWAAFLYVIARIGFANANIFYDALLPHVAPRGKVDQVSTLGYAFGYLGGGLLLAVNLAMITRPAMFGLVDSEMSARFSFLTVALWWGIFSLPLFFWLKEPPTFPAEERKINPVVAGYRRIRQTIRDIRQYRNAARFLLAFWLYNDGIGTIIVMAVIFGREIGIDQNSLIGAILLVQFLGFPFALLFGKIAQRIGAKNSIFIGLIIYTGIAIGGLFLQTALHFWMLAVAVAVAQGGTQALSRSLYSTLIPLEKSAEFFGFYDVSQKFSGIIGPTVFGVIGQLTGSGRLGVLALVVFFIGGALILATVDTGRSHEMGTTGS